MREALEQIANLDYVTPGTPIPDARMAAEIAHDVTPPTAHGGRSG